MGPHSTKQELHTVHLRHRFDVPVERLFRAWSDPAELARWAWGSIGHSVRAEVDFRIGGSFRIETARENGERWAFTGVYAEIQPNERIAHTLAWQAPMGYPSVPEEVEVRFQRNGEGSAIEFTHKGVPDERSAEGHRKGWKDTFETLAARLRTMSAIIATILVFLGTVSLTRAVDAPRASIDRLAWLAGCWQQERANGVTHEQWMQPLGGSMLGMSRTVIDGRTKEFEAMRIEERDGKLVFTAHPSGQSEASFTGVEVSDAAVVFSNLAHDFPQKISYRKQADGSLLARVEGESKGKSRAVDFPMKRVGCPDVGGISHK